MVMQQAIAQASIGTLVHQIGNRLVVADHALGQTLDVRTCKQRASVSNQAHEKPPCRRSQLRTRLRVVADLEATRRVAARVEQVAHFLVVDLHHRSLNLRVRMCKSGCAMRRIRTKYLTFLSSFLAMRANICAQRVCYDRQAVSRAHLLHGQRHNAAVVAVADHGIRFARTRLTICEPSKETVSTGSRCADRRIQADVVTLPGVLEHSEALKPEDELKLLRETATTHQIAENLGVVSKVRIVLVVRPVAVIECEVLGRACTRTVKQSERNETQATPRPRLVPVSGWLMVVLAPCILITSLAPSSVSLRAERTRAVSEKHINATVLTAC